MAPGVGLVWNARPAIYFGGIGAGRPALVAGAGLQPSLSVNRESPYHPPDERFTGHGHGLQESQKTKHCVTRCHARLYLVPPVGLEPTTL